MRPTSATICSPLTWAPLRVVSRPLIRLTCRPASRVLSLQAVPLPFSLPVPLLPLAKMLRPAPLSPTPKLIPTAPPLLLLEPVSFWVLAAASRWMSRLAASSRSLLAWSWLPWMRISPSSPTRPLPVARMLRLWPAARLLPWLTCCSWVCSELDFCEPRERLRPTN
ncbi:hypothetical protein D9M68_798350 [compost metagenome]